MTYEEFRTEWFAGWRRIEALVAEARNPMNALEFTPGSAKREELRQAFLYLARMVFDDHDREDGAFACVAMVYQIEMPRLPAISTMH
jgi:hypothetical protein